MLRAINRQLRVCFPLHRGVLAASFLLLLVPAQGRAAVEIPFHAHEFDADFPHFFVPLAGPDDRSGQRIDADYGFTATQAGPDTLFGSGSRRDGLRSTDSPFASVPQRSA